LWIATFKQSCAKPFPDIYIGETSLKMSIQTWPKWSRAKKDLEQKVENHLISELALEKAKEDHVAEVEVVEKLKRELEVRLVSVGKLEAIVTEMNQLLQSSVEEKKAAEEKMKELQSEFEILKSSEGQETRQDSQAKKLKLEAANE
jgi:hypothetical protein